MKAIFQHQQGEARIILLPETLTEMDMLAHAGNSKKFVMNPIEGKQLPEGSWLFRVGTQELQIVHPSEVTQ